MGMTIDEHKEHLLDIMDSMPDDACGDWRDSLAYAIETMRKYQKIEQDIVKPVLDKIRAEIIELRSKQNVGVLECLDIIDKYKTESEDNEE